MCLIESVCVKESKSVLESSSKDLVCLDDVSSVIHTVTLPLTRRMTLMGVRRQAASITMPKSWARCTLTHTETLDTLSEEFIVVQRAMYGNSCV